MTKFQLWLDKHYPICFYYYNRWYNRREDRKWERFLKRNRDCCDYHTMKHCAKYLNINPKKACCWDYIPERCPECGRKIPKRIMFKYMRIAVFILNYETHAGK